MVQPWKARPATQGTGTAASHQRMPQSEETFTADAGYWNTETVQQALQSGAQVLVPPDGAAALEAREPRQMARNPLAQQMRQVLNTEAGRALYRMRQTVVEPVFGSIKELRCFRRFKLRGLTRVQAEWQVICTTHNLLKLFRYQWLPAIA